MSSEWFIIIEVKYVLVYTFPNKLKLILVSISQIDVNIFRIFKNLSIKLALCFTEAPIVRQSHRIKEIQQST